MHTKPWVCIIHGSVLHTAKYGTATQTSQASDTRTRQKGATVALKRLLENAGGALRKRS